MTIKTFRGSLADLGKIEINLRTNDGKTGYRVTKFQILTANPGADQDVEHIIKVFKSRPPSSDPTGYVNFEDQELLAVGFYSGDISHEIGFDQTIFFDNEVFNQNIHLTHKDLQTGAACNYHLELEQIRLSDNETTMATLESIRSRYEAYRPAGPS